MRNMNSNSAVESDNHANSLDEVEADQSGELNPEHPRPDQFCIHRVNSTTNTLLNTVEYKPPHKFSVETFV